MAEEIFRYLHKTLKMSAKNVFSNIGQYACFFAAVFIIEVFFATLTVIAGNNDNTEWDRVRDEYDYHVVVYGLSETQMLEVENEWENYTGQNDVYENIRSFRHYNAYDLTSTYDIYVTLKGSTRERANESFDRFYKHLNELASKGSLHYEKTPLLNFDRNLLSNRIIYIVSMAALTVLSVFLLVILYNIRINHYKFIYGIYMSFGADFKKLFETAFWELFIVAAITFLPAAGVSVLISWIVIHAHGLSFSCSLWMLLPTAVCVLAVLLASVWFPMKIMAIKPPMSLIVAQDNSNLVSSPRRSFNIFGSKFPFTYELFSTWRFRGYNLRLLLSAVIFTSLFICGLYVAEIARVTVAEESPQYRIDLSSTGRRYDVDMREDLYKLPFVKRVTKSNSVDAVYVGGHLRVRSEYAKPFSNLVVPHDADGFRVTNDVQYRTIDEDIISELMKYRYDGDLSAPLRDSGTVVISDSISNISRFDFKVGDKIEIGVIAERLGAVDNNLWGKALLRDQLENYRFEYREFTIGAILYDIPSLKMPIYFSEQSYEAVTGKEVKFDTLEIYVDGSLDSGDTVGLEAVLRNWGMIYGGVGVKNTHALHIAQVNEDRQFDAIFTIVAALLLTISPMIWFFSQTLYYLKRVNEFTILQSMGALASDIRRLYIFGGLFMGILSFVFCIGLGYSMSYLLYLLVNVVIPSWTQNYVRYAFYMPWYAILLAVVMSVSCGFLSALLPYRSFMKRKSQTLSVEYGEVSD